MDPEQRGRDERHLEVAEQHPHQPEQEKNVGQVHQDRHPAQRRQRAPEQLNSAAMISIATGAY